MPRSAGERGRCVSGPWELGSLGPKATRPTRPLPWLHITLGALSPPSVWVVPLPTDRVQRRWPPEVSPAASTSLSRSLVGSNLWHGQREAQPQRRRASGSLSPSSPKTMCAPLPPALPSTGRGPRGSQSLPHQHLTSVGVWGSYSRAEGQVNTAAPPCGRGTRGAGTRSLSWPCSGMSDPQGGNAERGKGLGGRGGAWEWRIPLPRKSRALCRSHVPCRDRGRLFTPHPAILPRGYCLCLATS